MGSRKLEIGIDHGKAAAIGCHQGEFAIAERGENTVEHVAGLIGGDGVGGFLEPVAQRDLRDFELLGFAEVRQRRKLGHTEADDLEKRRAAADGSMVFGIHRDLHLAGGQLADDAHQAFRRQCGGAFLFNLGFHRAGNAHIKVRGGELQPTVLGDEQHVGEDGQRGAGADDVLDFL